MLSVFNVGDDHEVHIHTRSRSYVFRVCKGRAELHHIGLLSFVHSMTVDVVETAVCCAVYPFWSIIPEMGNYHVAIELPWR